MTAKISKTVRTAIRRVLDNSTQWDGSSLQVTADGTVTAKTDGDKTGSLDWNRYSIAHWKDMVTAEGEVREGY